MHLLHFLLVLTLTIITSADLIDFGLQVQNTLKRRAVELLGVNYLPAPASEADYVPREDATAMQRVVLSEGLKAEFITRAVGEDADMMAFWPNENNYSHIIICIEGSRSEEGNNPGVQRVHVASGTVENIVFGMSRCDGIRTTPWGTILATEETDDGAAYEIFDPLKTTEHWIADRTSGEIFTSFDSLERSKAIFKRTKLPIMAWEGLAILTNGVVYAGDELRPGTGRLGSNGGSIFKFVPEKLYEAGSRVTQMTSPFVAGRTYAMQISCYEREDGDFPQYGQGCEVGNAVWVEVSPEYARFDANARDATGYYRPEDLHQDPTYTGVGVRWCVANTGRADALIFGEVLCVVDESPEGSALWLDERTGLKYQPLDGEMPIVANVTRFVEGGMRFNSVDNLAFNPKSGLLYVVEDDLYGEVYACLPDGADDDVRSDGCVPFLSVVDPEAEPTGFTVDGTGRVAYVHIQHGECPQELKDFDSNPFNGCTDDMLRITGFKMPKMM